jgi:hypothetical protein
MVVTALVAAVALDTAEHIAAGVHVNPGLVIPAIDGLLHEICCACTAVEPPIKTAPKPQIEIASIRRSGAERVTANAIPVAAVRAHPSIQ